MSYALGTRIKELRQIRKISQEQMANVLDMSRKWASGYFLCHD